MRKIPRTPVILLTVVLCGLIASGLTPKDRLTWLLEILPIVIALPFLVATFRRHPLTPLLYWLLALHAAVLLTGGHYTYAEVPAGRWIQETFGMTRNPYDRLGHFVQGFVPALLMRELLLTTAPLKPGHWLFFLVCSACLAFSALYELFEWAAALALGQSAMEFLGTQGDQWDSQWDMGMALIGAITAQLVLAPMHDRQLRIQPGSHIGSSALPRSRTTKIACLLIMATLLFGQGPAMATPEPATQGQIGQSPLQHEPLGLFDGTAFTATTGRCTDCSAPPQALWYFADETIAIPAAQESQSSAAQPPFLVWLGSPELIPRATLASDRARLALTAGRMFGLVWLGRLLIRRR